MKIIKRSMGMFIMSLLALSNLSAKNVQHAAVNKIVYAYVTPIKTSSGGLSSFVGYHATFAEGTSKRMLRVYFTSSEHEKTLVFSRTLLRTMTEVRGEFEYTEYYGTSSPVFTFELVNSVVVETVQLTPTLQKNRTYTVASKSGIGVSKVVTYYNGSTTTNYSEQINCENFNAYLNSNYGLVDLNQFRVRVGFNSNYKEPIVDNVFVLLNNIGDYFHGLANYSDGLNFVTIPLQFAPDSKANYYHLELKEPLYVNPITRECYSQPGSGRYPTTKYLYLPRNSKKEVANIAFNLSISGLGYSRSTIQCSFYLNESKGYDIGNCGNADYCLISSSSEYSEKGIVL